MREVTIADDKRAGRLQVGFPGKVETSNVMKS